MIGYAMGMLLAWGRDSGWAAVRRLAPAFLRSMVSAAAAGASGWLVVNALLGDGPISVGVALGVAAVGGLTALAAFLGVSVLLRSPEMGEVLPKLRR
jgi:hypothetical protein